jgi:predicted amidohydrolase YtcJ
MRKQIFFLLWSAILFTACTPDHKADLIIFNANIYTVDSLHPSAEAVAVRNGIILDVGKSDDMKKYMKDGVTQLLDAEGHFLMPGFIEGHGHFSGLGYSLINLNFLQSKSWESIVDAVAGKAALAGPGEWIIGRGWHQEKWDSIPMQNIHSYPFHHALSDVSPENPVVLFHASGHSLYANKKAMDLAGVSKETPNPMGGEIVRDKDGNAIGVFEERAMRIIREKYDEYVRNLDKRKTDSIWYSAVDLAQQECLKNGITSFQDAGSTFDELDRYEQMAKSGKLDIRLWAMARHPADILQGKVKKYKKIDIGNRFYTCNAIKSEVDGALGAFGAWLLDDYSDKPGFKGQNTTDIIDVKKIADMAMDAGMQFCVHAIGDRANRVVLDIYEGVIKAQPDKKDLRWRIEHAQHLNPSDIPRFAQYGIIASMQGIHCTSDAPFVVKRLGEERARLGAYAWRSLLDNGVLIANGTDAPVEDVNPLKSFYASVTRKREDNGMEFFTEQSMTRAEAIYSYTLGNAYAAFEDHFKGSISRGKVADFVILSEDLTKCPDEMILKTQIHYTIVDGKIKYENKNR